MPEPDTNNRPLVNDPGREAVHAMRGYSYQILRSVLAWIELADDEVLYLEGAEDLDHVAGDIATTTQIRDTQGSGNITLRSPGVLNAIDNYWSHRKRNPGRQIRFRYLSTSAIGAENGDPLGRGVPGIEVWRRAKLSDDRARQTADLAALKAFLLAQDSLSKDLKAFLVGCSEDELLHELIAPIDWDIAAEDVTAILETIRKRLIVFGAQHHVPARDAEAVTSALYLEAWTVATRNRDRSLDRPGFIRVFDDNTGMFIPKAQYTALVARLAPAGAASTPLPAVVGDQRAIEPPSPLPQRYYRREALLAQVAAALLRNPVVILQGSTGMGKTTSAIAFASTYGGSWGCLNLRGRDIESIQRRLATVLGEIGTTLAPFHLIVDDLDTGQDLRNCEAVISRLAAVQRARAGLLVICVAHEPPPRIMQALRATANEILRVPRFEREDIEGFLVERGCADPDRRASWTAIIEVNTLGHPQLVHARIAPLEAVGYPPPEFRDLIETPGEVLDARAEARKLLARLESSARELIYRLSLTAHMLSRDQVIAIAGVPPAISEPGNALDHLVGPWLEQFGAGVYRTSPLVRNAGEAVYGAEWVKATHGGIAWALLNGRTLSQFDVTEIIFHALAGRNEAAIARLAFGIMEAGTEVWRSIGEAAFWVVPLGVDAHVPAPVENKGTLFLFRMMQLRIARVTRSEALTSVITRALGEFPPDEESTLGRLARHLILSEVLLHPTRSLGLLQLLGWAHGYIRASDDLGDIISGTHPAVEDPKLTGPDGSRDFAIVAGVGVLQRVENRADLADLLVGLETWNDTLLRRLLWLFGQNEVLASLQLNRLWLAEVRTDAPDWIELLSLYERFYSLARRCDVDGLARAVAKVIARMIDEDLHAPQKALERATSFADELGDTPSLRDGRARILVHLGDDATALDLWQSALPYWHTDEADLAPSLSYRDAAMAAARLHRWGEAAELFAIGAERIGAGEHLAFRAGFLFDSGFSYWKSDDKTEALSRFAIGVRELDRLQSAGDADPVYSVQKRAGHMLMWVQAATSGRPPEGFPEPPPGCCSNLEPMEGGRPAQSPIDLLLLQLVQFETTAGIGDEQFQAFAERLRASPYAVVRPVALELIIRVRLQHLDMIGYFRDAIAFVRAFALAQQGHTASGKLGLERIVADAAPALTSDHQKLFQTYTLFAIFALAARGNIDAEITASWRRETADANVSEIFDAWLDLIEGLFVSGHIDANAMVRRRDIDWIAQCLAALRLAINADTEPAFLIQCHGLWLSYFGQLQLPNRELIGADVADLVAAGWERSADKPFLLHTPGASVPALRKAIAGPELGWARVKRIVGAALNAVRYDVGSGARDALAKFGD